MNLEDIKSIAIIGAGTMGNGIAQIAAMGGYKVILLDKSENEIKNAMNQIEWSLQKFQSKNLINEAPNDIIKHIHSELVLSKAVENVDYVIEALPEIMKLKKEFFKKMDKFAPKHTILSTNTSALPISEFAEATKREDKVIGMHFSNPPPLMPILEIIKGKNTSDETLNVSIELGKKLGKQPVIVHKDVPGFILNRINPRVFNEAGWIVYNGDASIDEVDATARFELGFPMGLFSLTDLIGLDVGNSSGKEMSKRGFKSHICPLGGEKVKRGEFGVKAGKGFYEYPSPGKYVKPEFKQELAKNVDPVRIIAPAVNEAAWLIRNKIATKEDIDKSMKLGMGYARGLLQMADEYGLDRIIKMLEKRKNKTGWEEYELDPLLKEMHEKRKKFFPS